jgi:hypothetical protein
VLSFIADEAFDEFFRRFKVKAPNAHAHRQRYLIEAALSGRMW